MATRKAKKARGKTRRRTAVKRRPGRRVRARRAGGRRPTAAGAAAKRVVELEAENRRLRAEIDTLRARLEEKPAPAFGLAPDDESAVPQD
jgi:hypothetical protein